MVEVMTTGPQERSRKLLWSYNDCSEVNAWKQQIVLSHYVPALVLCPKLGADKSQNKNKTAGVLGLLNFKLLTFPGSHCHG